MKKVEKARDEEQSLHRVAAVELARAHCVGGGVAAEPGWNGVSLVSPELLPDGGEGYELPDRELLDLFVVRLPLLSGVYR